MKEWGVGGFLPQGTVSLKKGTKFPNCPSTSRAAQPAKKYLLFTHFQPPFPSFSGVILKSGRGGDQEVGDGANPNLRKGPGTVEFACDDQLR